MRTRLATLLPRIAAHMVGLPIDHLTISARPVRLLVLVHWMVKWRRMAVPRLLPRLVIVAGLLVVSGLLRVGRWGRPIIRRMLRWIGCVLLEWGIRDLVVDMLLRIIMKVVIGWDRWREVGRRQV
jgi:hypothetical protein